MKADAKWTALRRFVRKREIEAVDMKNWAEEHAAHEAYLAWQAERDAYHAVAAEVSRLSRASRPIVTRRQP